MFQETQTPDEHRMKHIYQYSDSDNKSIRDRQSVNTRNNRIQKIGRNGDLSTNLKMQQGCIFFDQKYEPNSHTRQGGRLKPKTQLMTKNDNKIAKTSDPIRKQSQQNNISKTKG